MDAQPRRSIRCAPMGQVIYYRRKASQCRRFANTIAVLDDPVRRRLLAIAAEFDAKADAAEAQAAGEDQNPPATNRISR